MEHSIITLLPPTIAIVAALITKRVLLSLFLGVISAQMIVTHSFFDSFDATALLFVSLFKEDWIVYTLFFIVLVGSIIRLLEASNAVLAFTDYLTKRHNAVTTKRGALFLGFLTGIVIFIESSLSALIVATVTKPFSREYDISKEKIAYLCDTTSAPVCCLVPLNGWGALLISLFTSSFIALNITDITAVELLLESILFNFYAIISLIVLGVTLYKGIDLGSMKRLRSHYTKLEEMPDVKHRMVDFIVPLFSLITLLLLTLAITGDGSILKGNGSKSLFIAVIGTLVLMFIQYVLLGRMSEKEYSKASYHGINDLLPVAAIMLFAFLLAGSLKTLGTSTYVGSLFTENVSLLFVPLLLFILSVIIAFSTGSSWGTFTIMIPIALASVEPNTLPLGLIVGAVLSGGVFGDHASPISDTTILASLASECDHIDHVKTQLPYALLSAFLAAILFFITTLLFV